MKSTPDNSYVACQRQASTDRVDVVGYVGTQVNVTEDDDVDIREVDTDKRCTCGHQKTRNTTITVELADCTNTSVTLKTTNNQNSSVTIRADGWCSGVNHVTVC